MVDVGEKQTTHRIAIAAGTIFMRPETLALIHSGNLKKGDVFSTSKIAGIMACKKTAGIIPLCHPLPLSSIEIEFETCDEPACVKCRVQVETHARTGVEIEAMVAVQVALLTIYDMCKAVDRGMMISEVRLLRKSGGQSGDWKRPDKKL